VKLCIYCAGGFGKEVFDIALRVNQLQNRWSEIFFTDDDKEIGSKYYSANLLSIDNIINNMNLGKVEFIIANGEPFVREAIYSRMKSNNIKLATIIDPSSIISSTAVIGEGAIIAPQCMISSSVDIKNNVIINCQSIIGHDITVGENSFVSSMVTIGGSCKIGRNSYFGIGAQVKDGLSIGSEVIVGMGSVVYKSVPDSVIVLGNPARPMRRNEDKKVFNK